MIHSIRQCGSQVLSILRICEVAVKFRLTEICHSRHRWGWNSQRRSRFPKVWDQFLRGAMIPIPFLFPHRASSDMFQPQLWNMEFRRTPSFEAM